MKNPAVVRLERRLGSLLEEELSLCATALEQQVLIELAIKMSIGAWTIRYRQESPELKEKCLTALEGFTGFVVDTYRTALFHPENTKGSRQ
jgi:hypothetical protein